MRLAFFLLAVLGAKADCLPVTGGQILGRDLAAANSAFRSLLPDQVISYAPAPGTQRVMSASELGRILRQLALPDAPLSSLPSICFERKVEMVDPARMRTAMAASLGVSEEQMKIIDFSRFRIPAGDIEFPRAGLQAPPLSLPDAPALWKGRVTYDHGRTMPIWAKVRVSVDSPVITAIVAIGSGQVIQPDQVSEAVKKQFPFVSDTIRSAEMAVGKIARRSIGAGSIIRASFLEEPREVSQGEMVQVSAGEGQAQITFAARAQSGGHKGDAIMVQNPSNGRSFRARVVQKGKVEVRPSGV